MVSSTAAARAARAWVPLAVVLVISTLALGSVLVRRRHEAPTLSMLSRCEKMRRSRSRNHKYFPAACRRSPLFHFDSVLHTRLTPPPPSRRGVLRSEVGADWLPGAPPPPLTATPPDDLRAFSMAQHAEDVYAHEHFFFAPPAPLRRRVVLESGALDGVVFSVSNALESQLGWRALHIEAGPGKFERLARNRPRALNLHTALCDSPRELHFLQKDFTDSVGGIAEFMSPAFLRTFWPDVDLASIDRHPDATRISCAPLASLLALFNVQHVDLWVLDVEGAELAVLQTVDFGAVNIDVIVAELDGSDPAKDRGVWDLLIAHGYDVYATTKGGSGQREDNTWFVRRAALSSLSKKQGVPQPGPPLQPQPH